MPSNEQDRTVENKLLRRLNGGFSNLIGSRWLVVFLFTCICLAVFALQNHKVGFEQWHHGFLSSHGMTIAKNISPEYDLLMFNRIEKGSGAPKIKPYNRFPVFPFLLTKATMVVFGRSLADEVYFARQLMNAFLLLSLVFTYLALVQLSGKRLVSLAVAVFAYSNYFFLYYGDMVFNDVPALAGLTATMYGIAKFEKTNKSKTLFACSLFAVAMGWQVYSLLGVWWIYELIKRIVISIRRRIFSFRSLFPLTATLVVLASIAFGSSLLLLNFYNESRVTGRALMETPSAKQVVKRMGVNDNKGIFGGEKFQKEQLRRVAIVSTPYKLFPVEKPPAYLPFVVLGLLLLAPLVVAPKYKFLLIVFGVSGFAWTIAMRNFTTHHDFQALYLVGIPIAIFYSLLVRVPEKLGLALVIVAMAFFVYYQVQENRVHDGKAKKLNVYTEDFERISKLVPAKSILFVDKKSRPKLKKKSVSIAVGAHAVDYYMAGRYFGNQRNAEFVLSRNRKYPRPNLTPENKVVFLFDNR